MPKKWPKEKATFNEDYEEATRRIPKRIKQKFIRRSKRARKGGYYSHTREWFEKNVPLDPKILQKRLDGSQEYQRLQRILATRPSERKRAMATVIYNRDLPPVRIRMDEIQAKINPIVDQLCKLDAAMRREIQKAEFVKFRAKTVVPESDKSIHRKIAMAVRRIADGVRRQLFESNRIELRKNQGYWNYIEKKYGPKKTKEGSATVNPLQEEPHTDDTH